MKLLLIGKRGSINHWLEDAAAAFRADGHTVRVGLVRRSWLSAALEASLAEPLAADLAARAARFAPDLILAIGAFHVPALFLERLAALPGRPPLAGWVGDIFNEASAPLARLYDVVGYTDSALEARHRALAFAANALFLPHAANLGAALPPAAARAGRMVFVANATAGRRAVVEAITSPIDVRGPGWRGAAGPHAYGPRVAYRAVAGLYAGHLAALNIRNEHNVLAGLNQRSFDPYLSATPVVSDAQGDIERCFDPAAEVLVWRSVDELNAVHDRLRRFPHEAARIGQAGRARVVAEHGFGHRLARLMAALS